jgi:hypothetical protein
MAYDPLSPQKSAAKGGAKSLPPGAANVPGSRAYKAAQGQKSPGAPVVLDRSFVADPRGGAERIIGRKHVETRDNRTHNPR